MDARLLHLPMGAFAFKPDGTLLAKTFYPKDPDEAAARIGGLESGNPPEETMALIRDLMEKGYKNFLVDSEALTRSLKKVGIRATYAKAETQGWIRSFYENPGKMAVELGFVEKEEDYHTFVHRVSIALTRIRIRKASERKDSLLVQGVAALEEIDKVANLLLSRIREWYGLHFPEVGKLVENPETYLRIVANLGHRKEFSPERLKGFISSEARVEELNRASKESIGADFAEEDLAQIRKMAEVVLRLMGFRNSLETYISHMAEELAPNASALVGPIICAKLIARAGSLEKLSRMPSSTIQVLGAEKALFRSLRTGARPPKHGIIFQHPFVHQSPKAIRGKIARNLAGKLAIASRIDAYGGVYMGEKLREDLEKRLEDIKKGYGSAKPRERGRGA
ncbi:C/D box methylation guide ribonucleoprotein complex aNOP56 subunit [Candidatus Bathyarchaeota archaeon]|nr:C/D box methylation guide ribonucleoprotein complex aNOP56 subunit [Candidatus Bathyarchaeota archaeon]MBS7627994.1 C/D box methylation guide ribonucleoprotein complex aNOP56 subunit [Candidatus Bathyarchaeota archaeon]